MTYDFGAWRRVAGSTETFLSAGPGTLLADGGAAARTVLPVRGGGQAGPGIAIFSRPGAATRRVASQSLVPK